MSERIENMVKKISPDEERAELPGASDPEF